MRTDIPILSPPQARKKYLKDDKALDKKLKGDISLFSISLIEDLLPYIQLPNMPFRNTCHGFVFVLEGNVHMQLDVMSIPFPKHSFILTPAGQVNNFLSIDSESVGFLCTFHDHFFDNSQLTSGIQNFADLLNPENFPHFQLSGGLLEIVSAVCYRMVHLYHRSEANLHLIKHYLLTLLSELKPVYEQKREFAKESSPRLVTKFKQALLNKIRENPRPADLANTLNVSINHLNKVLKTNTQLSTSDWIVKRQIIEAQLMLRNSNYPVAEIAHSLGFEDPSYFSKFFSKHTQVTPSQYRKN